MVAGVVERVLGAAHRQRRLGGDHVGELQHAFEQRLGGVEHAVDQPDARRFLGAEFAPGVGQFAHHAVADQARQALQAADVGDHAEVDLLDREARVRGAVAHVGAGDQVHAAADAGAVDGGEHRLAAAFDAGERVLQVEDQVAQVLARARLAGVLHQRQDAHHHLQVDAGAEVGARAVHHRDARGRRAVDPLHRGADVLPHLHVQRVGLVGPVQRHHRDLAVEADAQGVELGQGDGRGGGGRDGLAGERGGSGGRCGGR